MNTEWSDILSTIINHPGLTSAEIAEKMEIKGYYRTMKSTEAAEKVAKICNKLRDKSQVFSAKIKSPVTGQTVNAWSANPNRPSVEADPVEVIREPAPAKTVMESRPCCEPVQKEPDPVEDDITDAEFEIKNNRIIDEFLKLERQEPYNVNPVEFIIENDFNCFDVKICEDGVRITHEHDSILFFSDEDVDNFSSAIKKALSYVV